MDRAVKSCALTFLAALAVMRAEAAPPEQFALPAGHTVSSGLPEPSQRAMASRLPLTFEVNRGQAPQGWDFVVRCRGYHAFVRSSQVMFSFDGAGLSMSLAGAERVAPTTRGLEQAGRVNYFLGNDPAKWISNAPTTRGARYEGVAPGTTWNFGGRGRELEFSFDLAPGRDEATLRFDGANSMRVAGDGSLRVTMPAGEATISRPVAWQETHTGRVDAQARFVVDCDGGVRVDVTPVDPNRATHVDPTVSYASFLGGNGSDVPGGAAMDSTGAAYYVGHTSSADFPTTGGAYDLMLATGGSGNVDVVVVKMNSAGSALDYSTFLGGAANETSRGLAIDSSGNAFVVAETLGNDYPTTAGTYGATAPTGYNTGAGVLTELNSAGSALVFSTYTQSKTTAGVALGPSGSVYIAEGTGVSRYVAGGTSRAFHTAICPPTTSGLFVRAVASDASGNAYVTGETTLTAYPVPTTGAYQSTLRGNWDAYVVKLTPSGVVVYSTYLGGTGSDYGKAIDVNARGDAYVVGEGGAAFPVTAGAFRTIPGSGDGFFARLQPDGSGLRYATGLGNVRGCEAVRVHPCGACVLGGPVSNNVLVTLLPFQANPGGGNGDGYLMKFNADNTRAWASYCGGSQDETLTRIGMAPDGTVAVLGNTGSTNFPVVNAYQSVRSSGIDLFVLKIPDTLPTVITPPTIGTMTMPPWTLGRPYSKTATPLGGLAPYAFTVTQLPLPPGLTLAPSGLVSGTPVVIGTFPFKVRVVDVCDLTADGTISITISLPPTISSPALRSWTIDVPCNLQIATAAGTAPFSFTTTAGATPEGLTLTPDGRINGTPTTLGDTTFTVLATDVAGASVSQNVTFRVNPPPAIVTSAVPPCSETFLYDFFFQTSGGTAPFTWSIAGGTPPSALGIEAANGSLNGAAGAAGEYDFTVRATDAAGVVAERTFHATVNAKLVVTTSSLAPGAVGRPYSAQLSATGGGTPLTWGLRAGQLPLGMILDTSSGLIHGTPQQGRTGGLDFTCADACGRVVRTLVFDVANVVDLASRKAGETIEFGGILPTVAPRAVELTGGTLLSITLKGGSLDDVLAQIVVTDAAGTPVDLAQWTKTTKKSVTVKGWPVPASGRWFISARVAPRFAGKAKLSFAITPKAAWPGGAEVGPAPAEFTFAAPPGAGLTITARTVSGTAVPRIVSVRDASGVDLAPAGTSKETAAAASFKAAGPLAGGDYRVQFASRDGSSGALSWTVKLKLPRVFSFELPDVPAGD